MGDPMLRAKQEAATAFPDGYLSGGEAEAFERGWDAAIGHIAERLGPVVADMRSGWKRPGGVPSLTELADRIEEALRDG